MRLDDEKLDSLNKLEVGMEVKILCNAYSREYNGRYFHNIDGSLQNIKEVKLDLKWLQVIS